MENYNKRITIAGHDISEFRIIHGADCYPSELTAAKELQSYIEKTAGVMLPIYDDSEKPVEREILIGKTNREGTDYTVNREAYAYEGFAIQTKNQKLIIAGAEERGTMYGVYEFLEKYLGWRFYTLHIEECHAPETIEIEDGIYDEKIPVFEYRELDWVCARDKRWAVKAKINGTYRKFGPEYGGELKHGGEIHSFSKYFHVDGWTQQPCLSDPENIKIAIEKVSEEIRKRPDIEIFEISQNDNQNYCKCDRCRAIDEEEGSHSGTLIRFINALSDGLHDEFPDIYLQTFAYQYTRKPPKVTKPRDNIIIKLCPMECCFTHPFEDEDCETNRDYKNDLEGWNKIAKRIYIWDYSTNYSLFLASFPNFEAIRKNTLFYAEHSVRGLYPEANYIGPSGEFAELRSYLHAKLMWDPYMSREEYYSHMDDFLRAYYGDGWINIRHFIDFIENEGVKHHMNVHSKIYEYLPFDIYRERLDEIEGWWLAAEEAAKNDPMRLANIRRSKLQFLIVKQTITHKERYIDGDVDSQKKYCLENTLLYNAIAKDDIAWREGSYYAIQADFTRPPLEWERYEIPGIPS